jgi:hypothetical protein
MNQPASRARRPRRRRTVLGVFIALAGLAASACADLGPLEAERCGNGVIEPERGEECDGFSQGGAACRPPGSIGECRLDCSAPGSRCPAGMGCGQDGICRAPSGSFDTWGPTLDGAMLRLLAADFDGDGRGDLLGLGTAGISVSYLEATGAGVKTTRLASATVVPAVGDLTADGIDDLAHPDTGGLGVLQGSPDRSLSPIAYSTDLARSSVLVAVDADATFSGDETLAFTGSAVFVARAGQTPTLLATLSQDAASLGARFGVGRFDSALSCESVAIGWKGADSITLLAPCAAKGSHVGPIVALPSDARIDDPGGVTALDVDRDGHLDLVAWTKTASAHGLAIAYGDGEGAFFPEPGAMGKKNSASVVPGVTTAPLAVGHLNGDSAIDFVSTLGIHVSSVVNGEVSYTTTLAPTIDALWDEALVADLNGNGIADVVASSSKAAGIDFFNGAGEGRFAYAKIPTTGGASRVTVGDFDGDLLSDLAMAESGSAEVGGASLSVAFGQPAGPPAAPVSFGRLGTIDQIVAENALLPGQGKKEPVDAMTDLVVVSHASDTSTTSRRSYFAGTSSRLMESPFFLYIDAPSDSSPRHVAVPRHITTGLFAGADTHLDLAVAGRQPSKGYGLWLLAATGQGDLTSGANPDALPDGIDQLEDTHLVAVNLGPASGRESVVLLTRWKGGDDPKEPSALLVARSDGARFIYGTPHPIAEEVATDRGFSGRALACDVDGDGLVDVIAATATPEGTPGAAIVFWNDGTGDIDVAKRTVIPNPDPTASDKVAGDDGRVTSVACLHADRDAAGELAIVLSGGIYLAKVDRATRRPTSTRKLLEASGEALEGGVDAAPLDVDGDGLEDLAIADATGVHIYRARPEVE